MIAVRGLIKRYNGNQVLKGISFEVAKSTIFGFLGPNGAGKTTTINILTGLLGYDGGEVIINGNPIGRHGGKRATEIGYLPENPMFYGYMTGREYLKFIGRIAGYNSRSVNQRIDELLELCGISDAAEKRIQSYSRGMKQRLGLAVAIFDHPSLLFLDEPTSALDPEGRADIMNLILKLKQDGVTVFLSTHILSDAERICDTICILNKGQVILQKGVEELRKEFIQPVYDVEFEQEYPQVIDELQRMPWVSQVKAAGNKLSIYINDINAGKVELIRYLGSKGYPVTSYSLRMGDLEDIFMKVVHKNDSI